MSSHLLEEALRYLGAADAPETLRRQVEAEAETLSAGLRPRYVYKVCELDFQGEGIFLRGTAVILTGETARKMLAQCRRAALLACTLGARFDLSLSAMQARDMARAVILDACGSALVEQGCDEAEKELSARFPGQYRTDRFSPGYGDFSLEYQKDIFAMLECSKRIGVTLTAGNLMMPSKSVPALIGLTPARGQSCQMPSCSQCGKTDCEFRQEE